MWCAWRTVFQWVCCSSSLTYRCYLFFLPKIYYTLHSFLIVFLLKKKCSSCRATITKLLPSVTSTIWNKLSSLLLLLDPDFKKILSFVLSSSEVLIENRLDSDKNCLLFGVFYLHIKVPKLNRLCLWTVGIFILFKSCLLSGAHFHFSFSHFFINN